MRTRIILLTVVLVARGVNAEIQRVQEFRTHQPRDRNVLFEIAVTPEQDLLSFVPKASGRYRLTRVRKWLDKNPQDETIEVPGWPRDSALKFLSLQLLVSRDYAICIAKGVKLGERDDLISVVDLSAFRVVKTIQAPAERGDTYSHYFVDADHLLQESRVPVPTAQRFFDGANQLKSISSTEVNRFGKHEVDWLMMGLPSLETAAKCHFTETPLAQTVAVGDVVHDFGAVIRTDNGSCDELLTRSSKYPVSINAYFEPPNPQLRPRARCGFGIASLEGKYVQRSCSIGEKNWWGTFVYRKVWLNISAGDADLGSVSQPTNDSWKAEFAYRDGRTYVLIVRGGTLVSVYEIG